VAAAGRGAAAAGAWLPIRIAPLVMIAAAANVLVNFECCTILVLLMLDRCSRCLIGAAAGDARRYLLRRRRPMRWFGHKMSIA
jgi:hypothetical protein